MLTLDNVIIGACLTFLVGIVTFAYGWKKDRGNKIKTEADLIRKAATKIIRSLERWKSISLSLFHKCDIVFVEVTELITYPKDIPFSQTQLARDMLWKKMTQIVSDNKVLILKEDLQSAYSDLYYYAPIIKKIYQDVLSEITSLEQKMFDSFIERDAQEKIMNINQYIRPNEEYHNALLGNLLRNVRNDYYRKYFEDLAYATESLIRQLSVIVEMNDKNITDKKNINIKYVKEKPYSIYLTPNAIKKLKSKRKIPKSKVRHNRFRNSQVYCSRLGLSDYSRNPSLTKVKQKETHSETSESRTS